MLCWLLPFDGLLRVSEKRLQFGHREIRVSHDRLDRFWMQNGRAVHGDGGPQTLGVFVNRMTAALANMPEPKSFKRRCHLFRRNARQTSHTRLYCNGNP